MKKFSKKGVLLFVGAMAVCAFVMPSMASAASWGVVGSHHTLTSSNLGFSAGGVGTSMCANASFTARVTSAANLEITQSTFAGCLLQGPAVGTCVATASGTFTTPWTATARTTSDIQIHSVDIDIPLAQNAGSQCALPGQNLRITGTLTGARWHGNTAGRTLELAGASGLVSHNPLTGTVPIAPTGTITDVQETLTVT